MLRTNHRLLVPALALALAAFVAQGVYAQKIVCWKDKSGKTIGCGDRVPPEYQDNASTELDRRGVTRKTNETAEERARREAQEKQAEAQKAEDAKKAAEQRRQDTALLNTFSNEKEIDLKRDRDLQVVEEQLTQLRVAHKNAAARHAEAKARLDAAGKTGKPASDVLKDDFTRAQADLDKVELTIATREKEKDDIRKRYGDMKQRYITLKSGSGGAPAPTTAAAPAKK